MKNKLKALGIEDDMIGKVADVLKEEIADKYIPKSRFDEVNDAKKRLEEDVQQRDAQLAELGKTTGDIDALKTRISELQAENKQAAEDYEAKVKAMRTEDYIKTALMEAGLTDTKYLPGVKAYLPISELDIDNVQSVEAFKGKIAEAKSITSMWFKPDEPPSKELGGLKLNDPANKSNPGAETIDKGSYEYYLSQVMSQN